MTDATLDLATATRLEKAAIDNGFDQDLGPQGEWLSYGSTHAPLRVWLSAHGSGRVLVGLSRADVEKGLVGATTAPGVQLPEGATAVLTAGGLADLNRILRRAYQLARALPHELLRNFEQATSALPRSTEAERLVVQRVGQDIYRAGLLDYWEGRCAITGLAVPELLRASHIKPWADCTADAERLDVFNGLLLAPHLDALFDKGFITVMDDGEVVVSGRLDADARAALGGVGPSRVRALAEGHRRYLSWHRQRVFRGGT